MTIRRLRAVAAASAWVAVAVPALLLTGCAAGRVGGLYLLDDAIAVVDAHHGSAHTVLVQPGRTTRIRGKPVPTTAVERWIVLGELAPRLRPLRTSPMRKEQRLPAWTSDYRLTCLDLRTGRRRALPNTLDSDDQQIHRLRLHGDRLFAAIGERFNVQSEPGELRYAAYRLPDGPWESMPAEEGARVLPRWAVGAAFADLRSSGPDEPGADRAAWHSVQSFADLEARGLSHGSWGELRERKNALGRQEIVLKTPDGQETVLVRQVGPELPRLFAPGFGQSKR
jgi:hypothetical protein